MDGADTIFALASGRGQAAVAVLRVSGAAAGRALRQLTRAELPPARQARLVTLTSPVDGEPIDRALVLWFPAPASFTGEDVAELHLHGGLAVLAAATEALLAVPGLRPAEPGEFSRRAFLNGKMDLTEAEGLADLVAAETAAQRRQALRQMGGALGAVYEAWRGRLLRAMAEVEAEIDFADEADVPDGRLDAVRGELEALAAAIAAHLDDGRRGERLRDGLSIAILGPPNVGKSSLLNALSRREAAIVAATAGTTRDVIEVHMDLGGYPAVLADTAGLRESADAVEDEGIRRARARAEQADFKLVVLAAGELDAGLGSVAGLLDDDAVLVVNKLDLAPAPVALCGRPVFGVSARHGTGMAELERTLQAAVAARLDLGASPALTRARHRAALAAALAALRRAAEAPAVELAGEDLRLAARALGRITGRIDAEDILDIVFSTFCIGK
jgi:tRNA modification GTPase